MLLSTAHTNYLLVLLQQYFTLSDKYYVIDAATQTYEDTLFSIEIIDIICNIMCVGVRPKGHSRYITTSLLLMRHYQKMFLSFESSLPILKRMIIYSLQT